MKLYIAGHTGLVGSAFLRRFSGRADVEVLTATRSQLDLTNQEAVHQWLKEHKPDVVVVAAGRVGGIFANAGHPAEFIYENLMIEANLIHGAWQAGIKRLLNFGSSCMYPKHCPQPMNPQQLMTGRMEPTSEPYAIAKWAGLSLCASYTRQYGARFITAIPCTLYGPGDNFDLNEAHVLSSLIRKFHDAMTHGEQAVTLWGRGEARREFLYVDDVVEACERLLEEYGGSEPVNIGSGESHAIRELAELVADRVGFRGKILWDTSRPDGAPEKLLDSSTMRAMGWSPRTDFRIGLALEALNHIGHVKPNLLVILNDNKMSIAPPVGALSRYLNRMITNPLYNRIRRDLEELVRRLPRGARLVRLGHKVEESLKGLLVPGLLFEELGFRYIGPIDGHKLNELIATLTNLKRLNGPILLHVHTVKGKGYKFAEADPERFHKIEPFDLATGELKSASGHKLQASGKKRKAVSLQPAAGSVQPAATFTEAFSAELIRLAEKDERIVAITAAMPEGTGLAALGKRFPGRFIDVGMAEQHGLGLAAGLARAGFRPVVAIYSTFLQRAYDQIMHEICLQKLPVVLAIDRGGLVGEDGPTHHGVFDLAYLRVFPNLVLLSPKDPDELRVMLRFALARHGEGERRAGDAQDPVAIRYARGGILCGEPLGRCARIALGKAEVLQEGKDLAILALGSLVYPSLEAAARLKDHGVEAAVINARFVKPLDRALLQELATEVRALVTVEEAQVAGGFGSAVSEALEAIGMPAVALCRIGLPDQFVEHGKRHELLKLCQLDADGLTSRIATWFNALKTPTEEFRLLTEPS